MFEKLITKWKYRKEIKAVQEHPILRLVLNQLQNNVKDVSDPIGKQLDTEFKQQVMVECLADITNTLSELNPIIANRIKLVECMTNLASFDVIFISSKNPYLNVSGELRQYLPILKEKNESLKHFFYQVDIPLKSIDDMLSIMMATYWKMKVYVNAYNLVRIKLNDCNKDNTKDWFKPCYNSLLIWNENIYRNELNLPTIISGENSQLKIILHGTWFNLCQTNKINLKLIWETSWEKSFNEKSPYSGLSLL